MNNLIAGQKSGIIVNKSELQYGYECCWADVCSQAQYFYLNYQKTDDGYILTKRLALEYMLKNKSLSQLVFYCTSSDGRVLLDYERLSVVINLVTGSPISTNSEIGSFVKLLRELECMEAYKFILSKVITYKGVSYFKPEYKTSDDFKIKGYSGSMSILASCLFGSNAFSVFSFGGLFVDELKSMLGVNKLLLTADDGLFALHPYTILSLIVSTHVSWERYVNKALVDKVRDYTTKGISMIQNSAKENFQSFADKFIIDVSLKSIRENGVLSSKKLSEDSWFNEGNYVFDIGRVYFKGMDFGRPSRKKYIGFCKDYETGAPLHICNRLLGYLGEYVSVQECNTYGYVSSYPAITLYTVTMSKKKYSLNSYQAYNALWLTTEDGKPLLSNSKMLGRPIFDLTKLVPQRSLVGDLRTDLVTLISISVINDVDYKKLILSLLLGVIQVDSFLSLVPSELSENILDVYKQIESCPSADILEVVSDLNDLYNCISVKQ